MNLEKLSEPFPESQISWRAQVVSKDGTKAMALAYIDARDVITRLNSVCGVAGWQCRYSHADQKTVCDIGIKVGNEWIWKANGAGDTDIEAEKGALSDAFKRAAVLWGIGLYLYDMPCPWVPCESYESNGKKKWSKWTDDPWKYIQKPRPLSAFESDEARVTWVRNVTKALTEAQGIEKLNELVELYRPQMVQMRKGNAQDIGSAKQLSDLYQKRVREINEAAASISQN